jgi:hypothetical protein
MSTPVTAPAIAKTEQAEQLRGQVRTLTLELTELRSKLAHASGALAILNDKKQKFTEDATLGQTPKPGAIAALNVQIDEVEIPFNGFSAAVRTKEAALNQTRESLVTLDREIAIEAQQEARRARFDALGKQGHEVTARIAEKIRALVEDDLPALDQVRDSLTRDFVNVGGILNAGPVGPEAQAARALLHELGQCTFMDGGFLAVERRLLRAGWQPSGSVELTLRSLRPPKR